MNRYILSCFITLFLCQALKFVIESVKTKTLAWSRMLTASGGMPSSHTAFTTCLTLLIGLNEGFNSSVFAICLVFTCVVLFDSMGVRLESEKQAEAINNMINKIFIKPNKEGFTHLKEELGHEPIEVFWGLIFGCVMAIIFNNILF